MKNRLNVGLEEQQNFSAKLGLQMVWWSGLWMAPTSIVISSSQCLRRLERLESGI
jgi:hypothetical protein